MCQASPAPEEHPQYWATARRAAAVGRTAEAQDLLGLHSAFARWSEPSQRDLVQPLVRPDGRQALSITLTALRHRTDQGQPLHCGPR